MTEKEIKSGPSVLIYDGECPVCRRGVEWIQRHADENAFEMLACQSETTRQRFPHITRDICMESVQLVLPDGRVLSGAETLPEIAKRLKQYRSAAYLFKLPGAMALSHCFYRWFSTHRDRIAALLFPREKRGS